MALSYSAAAKPAAAQHFNVPQEPAPRDSVGSTSSSNEVSSSKSASTSSAPVQHLILDAGPLLSLTPLRHLAVSFYTTPLVLAELRDPKAREHWDRLGLSGVDVKVETPSPEAMAQVFAFARKTGDYAVLSQTDLSVIALTWQYEVIENGVENLRSEPGERRATSSGSPSLLDGNMGPAPINGNEEEVDDDIDEDEEEEGGEGDGEGIEGEVVADVDDTSRSIEQVLLNDSSPSRSPKISQTNPSSSPPSSKQPQPSDSLREDDAQDSESDGGDWITASNLTQHRNRDLGLLPDQRNDSAPKEIKQIAAACMTGDFAVQNVLLGMGLGLVGEGGKRISKVKSWVLRCHACFKLCKDPSKRFCPSCGNATLLRTTVTTSASTGKQHIHLKRYFQYHLRGSKYSIPDAKPGRAKGQQKAGTGLILREDQQEWQNAVRSNDIHRQKEERKLAKGALEGWNDPDWLPEMITVGMSGKGRSGGQHMPAIGHGRKNPNQSRRKR